MTRAAYTPTPYKKAPVRPSTSHTGALSCFGLLDHVPLPQRPALYFLGGTLEAGACDPILGLAVTKREALGGIGGRDAARAVRYSVKPSTSPSTRFFFLEKLGVRTRGAQAHLVAFNLGDKPAGKIMMLAIDAIFARHFDAFTVDMIDRANMHTVGANYFHLGLDFAKISHEFAPLNRPRIRRSKRAGITLINARTRGCFRRSSQLSHSSYSTGHFAQSAKVASHVTH